MTFTAKQEADLNNSMSAAQNVALGTLLADVKDAASLASVGKIEASLALADFVDGGAAVATYTFEELIPQGATVYACALTSLVGFTGDTSAVIIVGDGTDTDRYNTGTPSVFTTIAGGMALGAVSGTAYHVAAKAPVITITSAAEWGSVVAGSLDFVLYYFS